MRKEEEMKSGPAYLDLDEAARWIATQLEKEGVAIEDHLVLRILNQETAFLAMVGLARAGDENSAQAGHILREAYWVLTPSAESKGDEEMESEAEGGRST